MHFSNHFNTTQYNTMHFSNHFNTTQYNTMHFSNHFNTTKYNTMPCMQRKAIHTHTQMKYNAMQWKAMHTRAVDKSRQAEPLTNRNKHPCNGLAHAKSTLFSPHPPDLPHTRRAPKPCVAISQKPSGPTLWHPGGPSDHGCLRRKDWRRHLD